MSLAPIVLFTYNRLWHTQETIEALQKNELANESNLFIYSDGGKDEESWKKVNEVREYLKTINGFKKVILTFQDNNIGLADSIISGVTKIVNQYGKIIVLEDDIVTSQYFLKFMNEALDFYEKENKVWHISGYLYPTCDGISENNTFFLNIATCWGWATWKRSWKHLEYNPVKLVEMIKNEDISRFNLDNAYNWYSHLLANRDKRMKTWAIRWYASFFAHNAFCLHPKYTLTKNIGNDNSGVHCGTNTIFTNQELENKNLKVEKIEFIENNRVKMQLKKFFTKGK
ncbi:MAG: hypothetical protein RBS91_03360 [Sulfurimonadaceae bacterium]|jgi:hypothetical protein|nr:hypothetical protein [Sulfurimonadaceae bacterium]